MPWGDGEEKVNPKTKETRNNTGTIPFTQHLTSQRHAQAENGADSHPHHPLNDPTKIKKRKHKTAMRRLLTLSRQGHTVRTGKAYKKKHYYHGEYGNQRHFRSGLANQSANTPRSKYQPITAGGDL